MVKQVCRAVLSSCVLGVALCSGSMVQGQDTDGKESSSTSTSQGRKFALLVGVDKYPSNSNFRQLDYPGTDVETFADVLRRAGFDSENVVVMTLKRGAADFRYAPTVDNINKEIEALLGAIHPRDSVVIGFSGHGILLPVQRKIDGKEQQVQESFYCPVDADSSAKNPSRFIHLDELYRKLHEKEASVKMLVVDACRAEPVVRERASSPITLTPTRVPNTVVGLFSCKAGQSSLEDSTLGRGVFFHYLIEGSKGLADANKDQQITLTELINYVSEEVPVFVRNKYGQTQVPDIANTNLERIPFLKVPPPDLLDFPCDEATADGVQRQWAEYLKMDLVPARPSGMQLLLIPPGEFLMGSPSDEFGRFDDEKPHWVTLTTGFYMGAFEVTRGQFAQFVEETDYVTKVERSGEGARALLLNSEGKYRWQQKSEYSWQNVEFEQDANHPVVNIHWQDAVAFCNWLSRKDGLPEYYEIDEQGTTRALGNTGYRLPTEAEWEYACRAGTATRYSFGDDQGDLKEYGNTEDDDTRATYNWPEDEYSMSGVDGYINTAPAGSYKPNAFGLFDMHGNVWEYCWDYFDDYPDDEVTDPSGAEGTDTVIRGGSWYGSSRDSRSAMRYSDETNSPNSHLGFRVVSGLVP